MRAHGTNLARFATVKKHPIYLRTAKYGKILLRRGYYPESVRVFTQAFNLTRTDDDKIVTLRNRGDAAMRDNNWQQALSDFHSYITGTLPGETPAGWRLLALVEINMDNLAAEEHARKAVKLAPERATSHATLSVALSRVDLDRSKKEFCEALKKSRFSGDALYAIAQASVVHEEIDRALIID